MTDRCFAIAGSVVRVTGEGELQFPEPGILKDFEVAAQNWDIHARFSLVSSLSAPQGTLLYADPARRVYAHGNNRITYLGPVEQDPSGAHIRTVRRGKDYCVQLLRDTYGEILRAKTVLTTLDAPHIAVENGGFLLHASCICRDEKAIVFTAPSGIGKSTQAALWETYRGAELINGDRILLRRGEVCWEAVGIPFAGSSGVRRNRTLPLEAIVCLSQAPESTAAVLPGLRAFRSVWEGCSVQTWDRQDLENCMHHVARATAEVPVLSLACRPDLSAVEALEQALRKDG